MAFWHRSCSIFDLWNDIRLEWALMTAQRGRTYVVAIVAIHDRVANDKMINCESFRWHLPAIASRSVKMLVEPTVDVASSDTSYRKVFLGNFPVVP